MRQQAMQSGFAFSGNPVIFSEPTEPNKEVAGGWFKLWRGPETIYSCKFSLPLYSLNLAEVIDGELEPIPLPDFKKGEWISQASDFISRTIYILGEYDNAADIESGDIIMLRGRIPSALYRQLTAAGKDIFTERFLNPEANFFLTTRTAGDVIEIPETELYPLCLILDRNTTVNITAGSNNLSADATPGIYYIDLDAVRHEIYVSGMLRNLINDFYISLGDSKSSVRVVITRSEVVLNRVRLRYRNSFDIPEIMAFAGELTAKPVSEEGDQDKEYLSYLPISDDFRIDKEESRQKIELTLDTGPIEPRDIPRLMELINSTDVALESPTDGSWIPVVVSAGDISFPMRPETPQSFEIKLKISEDDLSILEMLKPDETNPLRLFTDEYNDKFI